MFPCPLIHFSVSSARGRLPPTRFDTISNPCTVTSFHLSFLFSYTCRIPHTTSTHKNQAHLLLITIRFLHSLPPVYIILHVFISLHLFQLFICNNSFCLFVFIPEFYFFKLKLRRFGRSDQVLGEK